MSTDTDDVPDPLAGIDLRAWQPPAPPMGQIDAILSQVTEFTRVDAAPAMEMLRPPTRQRARWVALGAVVGAAAAVLVMLAVWPRPDEPSPPIKEVVVVPPPTPPKPVLPGATVAPSIEQCRAMRDREDWMKVLTCANERLKVTTSDQDAVDLADQAKREAAANLAFNALSQAVQAKDEKAARTALEKIPADSVYYDRAQTLFGTLPTEKQPKSVKTTDGDVDLAPCEPDTYLDEAREAGRANQWSKMLSKALAANDCSPSKPARHFALMAACKLNNKKVAEKYYAEFANNTAMVQTCTGVVDPPRSYDFSDCDAVALLDEAKEAGVANQWSKTLTKAEASNKCSPSRNARQMALMAACHLGNRDKALRYWKEFENNTAMNQICIGVVDD